LPRQKAADGASRPFISKEKFLFSYNHLFTQVRRSFIMNNPIKQMGITLAAALVMTAGMNCAGASQQQPTTTGRQTATPAPANTPAAAPAAQTATAAKTSAVDELDVAIRDASDCLNDNIPKGSKIVILNIESSSANIAEYIIDELIANAINDKNFSVVDRRQLEAIQSEQKFQMSGAVADQDALRIGQFFGAQTIVSGAMREMGGRYRMTARALAVETAVVQSQCNQNVAIAASATLTDLVNSGGGSRPTGSTASSTVATTSGKTTQAATAPATATASPATPAAPPIQGTMVPGESLTEKLEWLTRTADSHNTYIMEVNADESIAPHTFEYKGAINITIVLRGDNENRTIRLQSNGDMFTVRKNVTFILDNNITLMGHNNNNGSMVRVNGGTLKMNAGSTITGNTKVNGNWGGGGVCLEEGVFNMSGGTISDNRATSSYNDLHGSGGGVSVVGRDNPTFTMSGGTISGNNTNKSGGGIYMGDGGTFTMKGGTITGNTANLDGGGISLLRFAIFTKTGGIITGYNSDQTNGNAVRDEDDNILARRGHAVWVYPTLRWEEGKRKETTAGLKDNLSYGGSKGLNYQAGAWDK
jgi:TolB-like protein